MKKLFCVLLVCLLSVTALCGCLVEASAVTYEDKDIHLNLAGMSGTVVYSMVSNIMYDSSAFIGKIIRIEGYYNAYENPELGVVYHACIIPDASACCEQGIEFVWAGEHTYPGDYPELYSYITVTGRLESYMEGEYKYLHLVDAEVVAREAVD